MRPGKWTSRIVWAGVILLAVIGVGLVAGRSFSLIRSSSTGVLPTEPYDLLFVQHQLTTFVHIVPGFFFMVLGPLQFVKRIRSRHIRFHRWSGRILLVSVTFLGISALRMGFRTFGGANEAAATIFFASIFLFSFGKGSVSRSPAGDSGAPGMDDPRVLDRSWNSYHSTGGGAVVCVYRSSTCRTAWNCLLDRLFTASDCG